MRVVWGCRWKFNLPVPIERLVYQTATGNRQIFEWDFEIWWGTVE
jgi:hypothetical protein